MQIMAGLVWRDRRRCRLVGFGSQQAIATVKDKRRDAYTRLVVRARRARDRSLHGDADFLDALTEAEFLATPQMRNRGIFTVLRNVASDEWDGAFEEFVNLARHEGQLYEPHLRVFQRRRTDA